MSRGSSLTMARTPRWDTNQLRILLGVVNGCYFQEAHWTSRPSGPQSNFTQYIHGTWQWPPPCAMAKQNDRPRAKGAVGCPPCEKTVIFRRVGMSEQWRLAVSVGGFWLCSGRLDPWRLDQKKTKKSGPSGLAFLSVTSHLFLGNALCWGASTKSGVVSCSMSNKDPKSTLFLLMHPNFASNGSPKVRPLL